MRSLLIRDFPVLGFAASEAVNTLCTNLSFSGEQVRKILITSCRAEEGKSFLAMNILRTMASLGRKTVLVDCDLRRSVIAQKYGLEFPEPNKPLGLTHLLAGMAEKDDVIYETNVPGAWMVPVGQKVSNPLQLLNSERMNQLLEHLSARFDYVFVDAPPIGVVIDAAQIAKACDGILLAVGYNSVRRQELIEAQVRLSKTGCPILGTVLNKITADEFKRKKYGYAAYDSRFGYGSK